ncbi:hypothetical protein BM536_031985 [Streptomyces phaeoluteigriseus]|uniref:Helix-turn-helix domain-containing protein n=1 Tax=Streptomyces phaeoluteigriseus TaxID=114686 RepID=A0A1V6MKD4_9ACTN|nr:helix-turn-helix domain-containing protein [Streptomyces phaeoluteigriseus]OQD52732.1 hypothetical protein BM536_031985 [Streptomyces phaeoluteigriseus]
MTTAEELLAEDGSVRVLPSLVDCVGESFNLYGSALARTNETGLSPDARTQLAAFRLAARRTVSPTKPAGDSPAKVVMLGMGEVAALLGCTPQWARRLASRGDLPGAQRVGGTRTWVISSTDLDAYRDETEEGTHGEPGHTPPA